MNNVTKADIIAGLRELGLREGGAAMVHSKLSSFGHVEGGAETVVDAFMEVVTERGLLLFPTFNHNAVYDEGGVFDPASTPTTNGAIPEAFRKRSGVYRGKNPTHAFAAWGSGAEEIIIESDEQPFFDRERSPFARLMQRGGMVILVGTGYKSNTFHHFVEMNVGAPCLERMGEEYDVMADGKLEKLRTWSFRGGLCPVNDSGMPDYEKNMGKIEKRIIIGESEVIAYPVKEGYDIMAARLAEPDGCKNCEIKPRVCAYTVK